MILNPTKLGNPRRLMAVSAFCLAQAVAFGQQYDPVIEPTLEPGWLAPCPVCEGWGTPGKPDGEPGDCDAEDGHFLSMCWEGSSSCEGGGTGGSDCFITYLSKAEGLPLNVALSWGVSAGDYPPRKLAVSESSSPLVSGGVAHFKGPSVRQERPTLEESIDLVTGVPLLQEIDLELPFGGATYRHVRTYSELPGVGAREPGGCFGTGKSGYAPTDFWWDWNGQGWMIGESPLFLIDARYWASVHPTGQPRCYFMPDAHHAIPFVFLEDIGNYVAPPRFDALLEHNGTWIAGSGWSQIPTLFTLWLHDRSVKYTIRPRYEDVGWIYNTDTSAHAPPNPEENGAIDEFGLGTPYYGLVTAIEDRHGNRVEIEHCGFHQYDTDWGSDPNGSLDPDPDCNECTQNCWEKGQIRRIRLVSDWGGSGEQVDWTLLFVYEQPAAQRFIFSNRFYPRQHSLHTIYAYEGEVPCAPIAESANVYSCLTMRPLFDSAGVGCDDEVAWANLKQLAARDPAARFDLPLDWKYRVQYLNSEDPLINCAFDVRCGLEELFPWQDAGHGVSEDGQRLLMATVTRREKNEDPAAPSDEFVESTRHTIYRYGRRDTSFAMPRENLDEVTLRAVWRSDTLESIRRAMQQQAAAGTPRPELEDWPLHLVRMCDNVEVPVRGEDWFQSQAGAGDLIEIDFIDAADWRAARWETGDQFIEFAENTIADGSPFAKEMLERYIRLHNEPGELPRPMALSRGYAEATFRGRGLDARRYRLFQFLITPKRDQPELASPTERTVLHDRINDPNRRNFDAYRSMFHMPYLMLSERDGETTVPAQHGKSLPLETPMWVTVIDEYGPGSTLSFDDEHKKRLDERTPQEQPLSRRVVMCNAAGYVLKDRTWDGRTGDIVNDKGLMQEYVYENVEVWSDSNGNGIRDAEEETDYVVTRLIEMRSVGYDAAQQAGAGEENGLVTVYDYDEGSLGSGRQNALQEPSTTVGAIGVRRGVPEGSSANPANWIKQYIRHPNREDLVHYEVEFLEPPGALFSYDRGFDDGQLKGVDPFLEAKASITYRDFELDNSDPSLPAWKRGMVWEATYGPPAGREPGSDLYFAKDRTQYLRANSGWEHVYRNYGSIASAQGGDPGPLVEIFLDYSIKDTSGQERLATVDVGLDLTGKPDVLSDVSWIHLDFEPAPAGVDRLAAAEPIADWTFRRYNSFGVREEERQNRLRTVTRYKDIREEVGENEVYDYVEQWIFKDLPVNEYGGVDIGEAQEPGEINRFLAGRLLKSGRYLWNTTGNPSVYIQDDIVLVSELTPDYDSAGRMTDLEASGDPRDDPVSAKVAYDHIGEISRERHPDGTVVRNISDPLGRLTHVYRGTKDLHEYWGTAPPAGQFDDDLTLVEKRYYGGLTDLAQPDAHEINATAKLVGVRRLRELPEPKYTLYDANGQPLYSDEDGCGWQEELGYDWRTRHVWTRRRGEGPIDTAPVIGHTFTWLDNLDRVRLVATYGATAPDGASPLDPRNLNDTSEIPTAAEILQVAAPPLRLSETIYNLRGQVEEQREYDVADSSGSSYLATLTYYDHGDRPVWTRSPGGTIQRFVYNARGQQVASVSLVEAAAGEVPLSETRTEYDRFGHVEAVTTRERRHDAGLAPGDLDGTNSIATYTYQWHDAKGRLLATVELGTGSSSGAFENDVAPKVRDDNAPLWEIASNVTSKPQNFETDYGASAKLMSYIYDDKGRQTHVVRPNGSWTRKFYDSLGQVVLESEHEGLGGAPSRQTAYRYEDGRLTGMAAVVGAAQLTLDDAYSLFTRDDGTVQITAFDYGAEVVQEDDLGGHEAISAHGGWIAAVRFPDSVTGAAGASLDLTFQYYPDGLLATRTDARGVVHRHAYDEQGNRVETRIEDPGPPPGFAADPIDLIDRIEYSYDAATGLLLEATAYSSQSGLEEVVAQSVFTYDQRGNLLAEAQQHGAAVDASTPQIEYEWEYEPVDSLAASVNHDRLDLMKYPLRPDDSARRTIDLRYGAAAGDVHDLAERISAIADDESGLDQIAEYVYAGLARKVGQTYGYDDKDTPADPGDDTIASIWQAADASGVYAGLDRFGRTAKLDFRDTAGAVQWEALYGYDASDNRLFQRIRHRDAVGALIDNSLSSLFGYDGLDRLISSETGSLTASNDAIALGTEFRRQDWTLDTLGNWEAHSTTDDQASVTYADQLTNLRNEITAIDDHSIQSEVIYDAGGNLILDADYLYQYDGFGRLVQVSERGTLAQDANGDWTGTPGQWILHHTYDGLGRLIRTQRPRPGSPGQEPTEIVTRRFFYDGVRRVQEILTEPVPAPNPGGGIGMGEEITYVLLTTTDREYAHSPHYVDEVVCQFDITGEPLFCLQDANYNVVALVDRLGAPLSTYFWDAYGRPAHVEQAAAHARNFLGHQGLFFDRLDADAHAAPFEAGAIGIANTPHRGLHVGIGRWLQADPNASGQPALHATSFFGRLALPSIDDYDGARQYADGMNLFGAYASNPGANTDPAGLFIGLLAPMSVMDVYMDYNAEAIEAGANMGSALRGMLEDYAFGQLDAIDLISDWSPGESGISTFAASGVVLTAAWAKEQSHHLIPKFLLGIDRISNRWPLEARDHARFHRILEQEFRRYGLNPPNARGADNWKLRLRQGDVGSSEIGRARSALLSAASIFDGLTDGKYDLRSRAARSMNSGNARGALRGLRRLAR